MIRFPSLSMRQRIALAPLLSLLVTATANAQLAGGGSIGGGMGQAVCSFIHSPIVTAIVAIVIIALFIALMAGEGKGFITWVLRICIGVAGILEIGSILSILGLTASLGC